MANNTRKIGSIIASGIYASCVAVIATGALLLAACSSDEIDIETSVAAQKSTTNGNDDVENANSIGRFEPMFLRVATFNMLNDVDAKYWAKRRSLIMPMLEFHGIDICGSQELSKKQTDQLFKSTKTYKYIQEEIPQDANRTDGRRIPNMNNVIWYKADRFDLVRYGTFWFGPNWNPENRKTGGWGSGQNRFCNWVEFFDKQSGFYFLVFNLQWNNLNAEERLESADLLADRIDTIAGDKPVVVLGGFNAPESEKSLRNFLGDSGLKNVRKASITPPYGARETYRSPNGNAEPIDHIFISPNSQVLKCGTLSDKINGIYPSDHYPFVADVAIWYY